MFRGTSFNTSDHAYSTTQRAMSTSSVHADAPPELVRDPEGLQYETGPQLGKGGFAICHRAKLLGHDHLGSSTVALKIVKSKMEPPKLAQKVQRDRKILAATCTDAS
jgi:myosin-1